VSDDLDLAAAALRADARDAPALLAGLAAWLEQAIPDLVTVQRKRAGLLDSRKQVVRITCRLGEDTFLLEPEGAGTSARRARTVRGITLKTETVPLAEWLNQLATALVSHAQLSEASTEALRGLVG
jgi:hypothetical protein